MIFLFKKTFLVYLFSGGIVYSAANIDLKTFSTPFKATTNKLDIANQIKVKEEKIILPTNYVDNKSKLIDDAKKTKFLNQLNDNNEMSQLKKNIVDLENDISAQALKLEKAKKIKQYYEEKYNTSSAKEILLKASLDNITKKIDDKNSEAKNISKNIAEENQKILDINLKIDNYKKQLELFNIAHTKSNEKLKQKTAELNQEKIKLSQKINEINGKKQEINNKNTELKTQEDLLVISSQTLEKLKKEISEIEGNLDVVNKKIQELNLAISTSTDDDKNLELEREKENQKQHKENKTTKKTEEKNEKSKKSQLNLKIREIKEKLKNYNLENLRLLSEKKVINAKISEIKSIFSILGSNISNLNININKNTNYISTEIENKISSDSKIKKFNNEFKKIQFDIVDLENKKAEKLKNYNLSKVISFEDENLKKKSAENEQKIQSENTETIERLKKIIKKFDLLNSKK